MNGPTSHLRKYFEVVTTSGRKVHWCTTFVKQTSKSQQGRTHFSNTVSFVIVLLAFHFPSFFDVIATFCIRYGICMAAVIALIVTEQRARKINTVVKYKYVLQQYSA